MDAVLTQPRITVVRRRRRRTLATNALQLLQRFVAHCQAGSSAPVWNSPAPSELRADGGRRQ